MAPSSNQFFSHLGIYLKDHLNDVGSLCRGYVEHCGITDEDVVRAAELIGRGHDFAKYTEFFQDHLANKRVSGDLSNHSTLSAIFASWAVGRELEDPFLAAVAFLCVSCHHGHLKNFDDLYLISKKLRQPIIFEQIRSIKKNLSAISSEFEEIGLPKGREFVENFGNCLSEVEETLKRSVGLMRFRWDDEERWRNYFITLLLYSSLIDADKKDAARVYNAVKSILTPKDLSASMVQLFREKEFGGLGGSAVDELREELFVSVEHALDVILSGSDLPKIMTITAPTGTGKTLLGLYVALKIREKLSSRGRPPRIVYCLPYINIIEQTHQVFERVLSNCYEEIPTWLLLKHHHLFFPRAPFTDGISLDDLLLLADSWESEIVVSTFEQFFRSVVGCRNALLKKFHNLANSVVILDEVQAIPLEYWRLVRDALIYLAESFNVTLVLMTATMPTIFRGGRIVATELVPNPKSVFERLDRTSIVPCLEHPMNIDELTDLFFSKWQWTSSALVVLNTIRTSKEVYRRIAERLGEAAARLGSQEEPEALRDRSKVVLAYLSTSVIPKERGRRIGLLKKLLKDARSVVLVSTQVVEAGVDLDFDMAFRDLGPLDSVIQVAGRCNRNWREPKGTVYVTRLIDDRGNGDAEKVYRSILPGRSLDFFKKIGTLEERHLPDTMTAYYDDISYRMNAERHQDSMNLVEKIRHLGFGHVCDFSLIKDEPRVAVFVEFDEDASRVLNDLGRLWQRWGELLEMDEVFEHRAQLRRVRAEMENYTVEVYRSENILRSLKPVIPEVDTRYIPRSVLGGYYNMETGFVSESEREDSLIL